MDLVLTYDRYMQRTGGTDERPVLTERTKGDILKLDQVEADRLLGLGAAEKPGASQAAEREQLEQQMAALKAQQDALEAQAEAQAEAEDAASGELSGKALSDALDARDLPKTGSVVEKRERLAEAIAAESTPPPPAV